MGKKSTNYSKKLKADIISELEVALHDLANEKMRTQALQQLNNKLSVEQEKAGLKELTAYQNHQAVTREFAIFKRKVIQFCQFSFFKKLYIVRSASSAILFFTKE